MKSTLIVSLLIIMVLSSCRKDPEQLSLSDQFTGTFVVERHIDYNYGGESSDTYNDQLLVIYQNMDTIFCYGSYFLIEYAGQTNFTKGELWGGETYESLTYSNNYQNISYTRKWNSQLSGPSTTTTLSGARSELEPNEDFHVYESDLEGSYILSIYHYHWQNNIDTTYIDTVSVELLQYGAVNNYSYSITIGTDQFSVSNFLTHYDYSGPLWQYTDQNKNLYWENDSIYYFFNHLDPWAPQTLQEEWTISGTKM